MQRSLVIALLLLLAASSIARAQGTLAAVGLGYPPGGLSTRVLGAAGAAAEVDPASSLNPAALAQSFTFEVYAQGHVERRRTEVSDPSTTSIIPSFPLAGMTLPVGSRWVLGVSLSSFLDRTWGTTTETPLTLDGVPVIARDRATSEGGMTDIRVGAAYRFSDRIALGIGGHVVTGENQLFLSRTFVDAPGFGSFSQTTVVDYFGTAVSAGVLLAPTGNLTIGASAQLGSDLDARQRDTVVSSATVPARFGGSVQYRIPGAAFAARVGWTQWTDLASFADREGPSPSTLDPQDGLDYAFGADFDGPSVFGQPVVLRTGIRRRDLPFRISGEAISETQVTGGLGIPLARGRALLDIAVVRASRSGVSGASERGWITSVGLLLRP